MAPVPSSRSSGRVLGPLPVGERNWGGSRKISRAQSHHAGHMQDLINSQSSLFQPYLAWGPLECPETWDWLASLLEKTTYSTMKSRIPIKAAEAGTGKPSEAFRITGDTPWRETEPGGDRSGASSGMQVHISFVPAAANAHVLVCVP